MILTPRFLAPALAGLALVAQLALAPAAVAGPKIEQWTAPSGARVSFVESRALPLVDIQIDFAAGTALDPAAKAGLASMTQALLDAGAGALDEQTIADRMADLGIEVQGGADNDRASLDDGLIFLHALTNAKLHYKQADGEAYANQLNAMLAKLKGKSRGQAVVSRGDPDAVYVARPKDV